jgi:6,7-dimethyl-8-ribityllumazine synthase
MTFGGFWPGEPPAVEDEEGSEREVAAIVEPPGWPQPRLEPDEQPEAAAEAAPAAPEATVPEPAVVVEEDEEFEEEEEEESEDEDEEAEEDEDEEEDEEQEAEDVAEPAPQLRVHVPGELDIPDDVAALEGSPSGAERTVGVVVSRFNGEISNKLLASALAALEDAGVSQERITVMPVPGAFELPIGAMALAKTRRYSCVVALGCVVRGETAHFDYVAGEAASGLQLAGLETGVPVAFGVLTVDTRAQAEARTDKGADAVKAALEMADLFSQLRAQAKAS